ncbi:hypothetical protein PVAP13_7NG045878 [Panicum virgatum]|uniref:Uncharacterized protein n=1 Tax=Panicum virgatum TaxID=38727 RepID=A0A8T0PSG2_PANVG|nr:hypothetical protein PVAP13_7NG045878 [Panicum virgatum]
MRMDRGGKTLTSVEWVTAEETTALAAVLRRAGEARGGDAVGWIHRRHEVKAVVDTSNKETEELGVPAVECAEAAVEPRVGEEAEPALADEGGTREG